MFGLVAFRFVCLSCQSQLTTKKQTIMLAIRVKYENSWYGYQGRDGFALYVNGKKMHIGLFNSVYDLRNYWRSYMPMLLAGVIPENYR